jgi:hypothetical protein
MTYTEYEHFRLPAGDPQSARRNENRESRLVAMIGKRRLVATIGESSRLQTSVTAIGDVYGIADPVPQAETYAKGRRIYRRLPRHDGTRYQLEHEVPNVTFGRSDLREAIQVDSSRLVETTVGNGTRLFELQVSGDEDSRTENVTGQLVVDDRGVVRSFTRRYDGDTAAGDAPANVSVTVSLRYEFVAVTVKPPLWLGEARRVLEENTSAFVPASQQENTAIRVADPQPA